MMLFSLHTKPLALAGYGGPQRAWGFRRPWPCINRRRCLLRKRRGSDGKISRYRGQGNCARAYLTLIAIPGTRSRGYGPPKSNRPRPSSSCSSVSLSFCRPLFQLVNQRHMFLELAFKAGNWDRCP